MSFSFATLGNDLYTGKRSVPVVPQRRRFYLVSLVMIVVAVLGLVTQGLNLGLEFRGGSEFRVATTSLPGDYEQVARDAVGANEDERGVGVTLVGNDTVRVQTERLSDTDSQKVRADLATAFGVSESEVSGTFIGPSWGESVSKQALRALVIFLLAVALLMTVYFRNWKMAAAALIALAHDMVITVGIYAWTGFEVSPATMIGFLTVLGYSLYDTVVVFDKVRENTTEAFANGRLSFAQAANLAVNQTMVRSINTTVIGLLPITAVLAVGAVFLGPGRAARPLARALRRHPDRCLLLDLHRHAAARLAAPARPRGRRAREEGGPLPGPQGQGRRRRRGRRGCSRRGRRAGPRRQWCPGRRRRRGRDAHRSRGAQVRAAHARRPAQPAAPHTQVQALSRMPTGPGALDGTDVAAVVAASLRDVPDFPQPGVVFKDITPLLADPRAFATVIAALGRRHAGSVDLVAGVEARGFVVGAALAHALGVGFVPVRKAGKLPGETVSISYDLEYGSAEIEVHADAFVGGERVLLVDDVLATGGTASAAWDLLEQVGADVVGFECVVELAFLGGRARMGSRPVGALLVVP